MDGGELAAPPLPPPAAAGGSGQAQGNGDDEDEDDEEEEMDGGVLSSSPQKPAPAPPHLIPPPPPPPPSHYQHQPHLIPPPPPSLRPPPPPPPPVSARQFADEVATELERSEPPLPPEEDVVRYGEAGWRERYYQHKLGIAPSDANARRALCLEYVRGLCWVLRYYYQGVPSWTWYFPYHYAPPATDLNGVGSSWGADPASVCRFELGEPFTPLEQLMAVLPPLSSSALPAPLAKLMCDKSSPLADCYPSTLQLDLNGASASWKAVVLLPFLDAPRLHTAFAGAKASLGPAEQARNRFGPSYLYTPPADALSAEVWALARAHAGKDGYAMAKVAAPVAADPGFAALLTPFPSVPEGGRRDPPSPRLPLVEANRVASAVLRLPSQRLHTSTLMRGVVCEPTLHPAERPRPSQEEHAFRQSMRQDGHRADGSASMGAYHSQQQYGGANAGAGYGRQR